MTKKLLFLCTALSAFSLTNAQEFIFDNYNALTIGNFGTDLTGVTAGQGGYYTFNSPAGGANSDYQIVADVPTHANVVQITGSATASGSKFLFKDITAAWAARTAGNNVINAEYDIYTGAATTSKNTARFYIYNDNGSTVLGGLILNLETKALTAIAYYDPNDGINPIGTYTFNLGASNAVINLPASSWVRIGVSYNTTTRQVIWKGPGFYIGTTGALPATGTTAPGEVDYVHTAGTANTVSATCKYDNLRVRASATENLLGKSDFNTTAVTFANVYPNPVVDFASINLVDTKINAITVVDINGRTVKTGNANELLTAKIDLSDLTAGIYLMTIETEKGVSTEKIVKK
jgi:hypothetical protein